MNNKERDDATSIVGDNGQVYMAGLPVKGNCPWCGVKASISSVG
ncbi:hypothetical protein LNQ03_22610 [Klebsiella pneumoniae subsp. pneumoniae]|nr:hypothetical protein [Klebsiella pneumoniae subsp. pneumoniae]